VWSYNLGAFELSTSEHQAVSAEAGVAKLGSAGGKVAHEESSLGAGGKLASCDSQDQRGCRVPIRLVLRSISEGQNPIAAAPPAGGAAPAAKGDQATVPGVGSAADQAQALVTHAKEKLDQGDGAACLDSANRAMGFDSRLMSDLHFQMLRASCMMASGKCEDGKKDFRAALAQEDIKREKKDFQLDAEARHASNELCTSATATNDADFVTRAFRELKGAAAAKDGKRCQQLSDGITEHAKKLDVSTKNPDWHIAQHARDLAGNSYESAAKCVAETSKKCSDGIAVMLKQCELTPLGGCKDIVKQNWPRTVEIFKIDCK
jgi:hypothetical protein